eukprot:7996920-Lingulodinium_polyedra.AAC.1
MARAEEEGAASAAVAAPRGQAPGSRLGPPRSEVAPAKGKRRGRKGEGKRQVEEEDVEGRGRGAGKPG